MTWQKTSLRTTTMRSRRIVMKTIGKLTKMTTRNQKQKMSYVRVSLKMMRMT
jgi:hypothetical protein